MSTHSNHSVLSSTNCLSLAIMNALSFIIFVIRGLARYVFLGLSYAHGILAAGAVFYVFLFRTDNMTLNILLVVFVAPFFALVVGGLAAILWPIFWLFILFYSFMNFGFNVALPLAFILASPIAWLVMSDYD